MYIITLTGVSVCWTQTTILGDKQPIPPWFCSPARPSSGMVVVVWSIKTPAVGIGNFHVRKTFITEVSIMRNNNTTPFPSSLYSSPHGLESWYGPSNPWLSRVAWFFLSESIHSNIIFQDFELEPCSFTNDRINGDGRLEYIEAPRASS